MEEFSLKKKLIRSGIVIAAVALIISLLYLILRFTGLWESINTVDKIRDLILSFGFWGRLMFVIIQFLQVTFIPLPSTVTILAGVLIYGPLQAGILSLSGILLGSAFAFFLGKVFGKRLVIFMVGKKTCNKWVKFLNNAKYTFFVMMILPVFPDDVLCLVAGITDMSWPFFIFTNLISRPIGIFTTCYLGSGQLIPFSGWGIPIWILLIIVAGVAFWASIKYKDKIENFISNMFNQKNKEKK